MKRLKSHPFKVNLISLTLLFPLYSYAETTPNEELEVIGVRYAKPITIAEPAQTTINWSEIEEQQYSNFASMIDAVPGASLDGGGRSGGERQFAHGRLQTLREFHGGALEVGHLP